MTSPSDVQAILAAYPAAVEAFKNGGELHPDLHDALWDYHFSRGNIRNPNCSAEELIAKELCSELGINYG
jgi:hypothetical protein